MTAVAGDDEDIVKHAPSAYVHGDWVDGFAFLPRPLPKDSDGSSVNRLRVLSEDDDEAMVSVRKLVRLKLRPSHRFAQIVVRDLRQCVAALDLHLTVIASPLPAEDGHGRDPSHALIVGLPRPGVMDDLIGDLIRKKIKRVHPAVV
jgi:hypothetical protein